MKVLVKMVYLEGICMVKADSHVVHGQCNEENPKGPAFCARLLCSRGDHNRVLPARDSWRVNTAHVSSFVLISILRGQPRTPPSGGNLGILDYHLNEVANSVQLDTILARTMVIYTERLWYVYSWESYLSCIRILTSVSSFSLKCIESHYGNLSTLDIFFIHYRCIYVQRSLCVGYLISDAVSATIRYHNSLFFPNIELWNFK